MAGSREWYFDSMYSGHTSGGGTACESPDTTINSPAINARVPLPHRIFNGTVVVVRFVPLSPSVGAEVVDFDITAAVPEDDQAELRRQFTKHHLLLVRGQELAPGDHDRFVGYFGPIQEHRAGDRAGYVTNRTDDPRSLFPEMRPLIWHNDGAYG